ncbi:MAG TPA: Hsp20/alpha crystallin family protein [Lachnospiraceae bacterium]|nr:Hsp20/alpha crystallin family protein [Lachnospiraceae bacterium]
MFGENLFDDFMDGFAFPTANWNYAKNTANVMKTDIKENDKGYELDVDLPGYKKEDVKAELKDGYLTISASNDNTKEEKDEDGKYIRKERYTGSVSRSFYVGKYVTEEDIHAKFENGILKLSVPKVDVPKVEENKYISIEG